MSFTVYMLCIIAALVFGMILEKMIVIAKNMNKEAYKYYTVSFIDKESAENVLQTLKGVLQDNGFIRVYDFYFLCQTGRSTLEDFKFGWTDINGFSINDKDGRYEIDIPEPHLLKK